MRLLLGIICVAVAAPAMAGPLWVQLGTKTEGEGLSVQPFDRGDGQTAAANLGGRDCLRTMPERDSTFIYVFVDDAYKPAEEVFLTVHYFDQRGMLSVDFDAGEGISAYRPAPEAYAQGGSGTWCTATFTLRRAAFKGRENWAADLRLHADGPLAVSRIELSPEPPEGFQRALDPVAYFHDREPVAVNKDMTVIQQWQIHEPVPAGQLADSAYEAARDVGITSLQSYVGWAQLEPEPGKLDYSLYDPVVNQIRRHGLKWLPFLITAPPMATPKWWLGQHGVDATCLDHGISTPIQSIWNPALRDGVRRFLEVFAEHYDAEVIEALNLGISGNWGESIMVAGGGWLMDGQHSHLGWWCGDQHARADWRRWAKEHYHTLDALNAAWDTKHAAWDDVAPFMPPQAPSRRAAADLLQWYNQSMTDYAEFWVKTVRELYPDSVIYLCTGGNGQSQLGADFAAQARMCARYGAGIRITNQSDHAPGNFAVTRMVSSATRLYGGYYTTEPGGANTVKGVAARIFDAVSGGARGVYFKTLIDPPSSHSPTGVKFAENAQYLVPNDPQLSVAALAPGSALAVDWRLIDTFMARTQELREYLDFEFIDENMIRDGLLSRFRALVVMAGDTVEQPVLEAIHAWVEDGGVLMLPKEYAPLRNVEDVPAPWWPADNAEAAAHSLGKGRIVVLKEDWPAWCQTAGTSLLQRDGVPWENAPLSEPLDGDHDNVLVTRAGDTAFLYNYSDQAVMKAVAGRDPVQVPARSIVTFVLPR